ncbi:hypothetical protein MMC30_002691 [Trapelia coarctata]|nr:hypothetical protein [Trapelia coarctata]
MSSSKRTLRSTTAATSSASASETSTIPSSLHFPISSSSSSKPIRILAPGSKLPGLTTSELALLRKKQTRLASTASSTLFSLSTPTNLHTALKATLIFAQHEAGTAVCIDPAGWLLTCSHCFGDTEEEYLASKHKWLLFYTGLAVQVECRVWDPRRDLALLKIIAVESGTGAEKDDGEVPIFKSVALFSREPLPRTPVACIGQPGSDDLESTTKRKTKYNLVEVSYGMFRGMAPGADPQDNSEIGSLMHDAWTYWGHSGAPLVWDGDGTLVALHSSWDEETGMRRGIPLVAIKEFLRENLDAAVAANASL